MELSGRSKALLQELCTDSRVKVLALSKKLGYSRYMIAKDIAELEKRLDLYYTLELDHRKLGFSTVHVTYFNFVKKPSERIIGEVLGKITAVQLAILTKGDFELVCFVVTKTPVEYSQVEIALQILFQSYGASVRSSEVTLMRHGFIPLSNSLIEKSDIDSTYKKILLALNTNSRSKLSEVSKSTGIGEDTIRYHLTKMEREGIIKRYTAIVRNTNTKFTVIYFANFSVTENLQGRVDRERKEIIFATDERSIVNDFQMMFATTGAEQTFNLATYIDRNYGMEHSISAHNRIYAVDKPEVKYAVVTKTIKGVLPFRRIDVRANYDGTNFPLELS
jgi:DNA-binding Lrp family transcriptional regulator